MYPEANPIDDIRWAEAQPGIAGAWMLDHLQGWFPRGVDTPVVADPHRVLDPLSVLSVGAVATQRITLGVAVTDPVRRSAVALAHTASTISWLGNRRMVLGLGVGDPGQLRPFGLHSGRERTGRLDYMRPALADLWALREHGRLSGRRSRTAGALRASGLRTHHRVRHRSVHRPRRHATIPGRARRGHQRLARERAGREVRAARTTCRASPRRAAR